MSITLSNHRYYLRIKINCGDLRFYGSPGYLGGRLPCLHTEPPGQPRRRLADFKQIFLASIFNHKVFMLSSVYAELHKYC